MARDMERAVPYDKGTFAGAGAAAGIAAGIVYAVFVMAWAALVQGDTIWTPLRAIGSFAGFEMGQGFQMAPVLAGMVIHLVLSAIYGTVFALLAGALRTTWMLAAGVVYGLVIYVVNFHLFAPLEMFSAFQPLAGSAFIIAMHAVFGLVLAIALSGWRDQRSELA